MKTWQVRRCNWIVILLVAVTVSAFGQTSGQPAVGVTDQSSADQSQPASDLVTLNVDDGLITQVLNAFSRQTGRSIVVGPEVKGNVTARLSNVQWRDALDSILQPHGYGYYLVGETIIVTSLDKLPKLAPSVATGAQARAAGGLSASPRMMKVFTLKYLDAADIETVIKSQLSPGGTIGRPVMQSQSWEETGRSGSQDNTTSESLGRLKRFVEKKDQIKGKALIVVDTPDVIKQIESIISQLDKMPTQVLIEAKFIEVRANLLRDIGFEWKSAGGISEGGNLYGVGGKMVSGDVIPAGFTPRTSGLNGSEPFNAGLSLAFQKLTDFQFQVLMHMLEEDASYNVLSSPRVLTMDNQDAVIIAGQKLPIITSDTTAGTGGGSGTTSTSLERYEDIGIKLKVLPQVCDGSFINLIVHPSVRDLVSYQSGKVNSGITGGSVSLTEYPVIATREAETQVLLKSGQTMVIGGMIRESKSNTQLKVPFLGSVPLLGVLFRRDTVTTEKIELLIFLTATVRDTPEEAPAEVKNDLTAEAKPL